MHEIVLKEITLCKHFIFYYGHTYNYSFKLSLSTFFSWILTLITLYLLSVKTVNIELEWYQTQKMFFKSLVKRKKTNLWHFLFLGNWRYCIVIDSAWPFLLQRFYMSDSQMYSLNFCLTFDEWDNLVFRAKNRLSI